MLYFLDFLYLLISFNNIDELITRNYLDNAEKNNDNNNNNTDIVSMVSTKSKGKGIFIFLFIYFFILF